MSLVLPSRSQWRLSRGRQAVLNAAAFGALWAVLEFGLGPRLHRLYSGFEVVWWRYGVHLAVVEVLWGRLRPATVWHTKRHVFQLARSILMVIMPASFLLVIHASASLDVVSTLFWTAPFLISICSWSTRGERPPLAVVCMTVMGVVAVAIMNRHLGSVNLIAIGGAVGMTLSFVAYVLMTRSLVSDRVETNMFYTALGPFLLLTPFMPMIWHWPDAHDAMIMTAIGIVGFVALSCLDRYASLAPVWLGAPALFAQVVTMVAVFSTVGGNSPGLTTTLAVNTLILLIAAAFVVADRLLHSTEPSETKANLV